VVGRPERLNLVQLHLGHLVVAALEDTLGFKAVAVSLPRTGCIVGKGNPWSSDCLKDFWASFIAVVKLVGC
jgi:hypothetical protein